MVCRGFLCLCKCGDETNICREQERVRVVFVLVSVRFTFYWVDELASTRRRELHRSSSPTWSIVFLLGSIFWHQILCGKKKEAAFLPWSHLSLIILFHLRPALDPSRVHSIAPDASTDLLDSASYSLDN